jgi:hypothetical protein
MAQALEALDDISLRDSTDRIVEQCEQASENGGIALRESNPLSLRLKPKILRFISFKRAVLADMYP